MSTTENRNQEFLDKYGKSIDRVNDSILEAEFPTTNSIYIELNTLKDTRLGAMLAFAPDKQAILPYIKQNLDKYNERYIRDFKGCYPDYPLGELELLMKYRDPDNSEVIFNNSPDTDFSGYLFALVNTILDRNNRARYYSKISLYINVFPLKITPLMERWVEYLSQSIWGANIRLMSKDPKKLDAFFWGKHGLLIFDQFASMVADESTEFYRLLFEEGKLRDTEIYAPHEVDLNRLEEWKKQGITLEDPQALENLFALTATYMTLCCKFQYMKFLIPVPKPSEATT